MLVIYQTQLKQASLQFLYYLLIQMVVTCMSWKLKKMNLRVMKVRMCIYVGLCGTYVCMYVHVRTRAAKSAMF